MRDGRVEAGPAGLDVAKLSVGIGGLALCLTLMYLGMRAVMDVGGACADGGSVRLRPELSRGLGGGAHRRLVRAVPVRRHRDVVRRPGRRHLVRGPAARLVRPVPLARLELPVVRRVQHARGGGDRVELGDLRRPVRAHGRRPAGSAGLSVFGSAPLRRSLFGAVAVAHRPAPSRSPQPAAIPGGPTAPRRWSPAVSDPTSDERREELTEISGDMGAAIAQALHGQAAPDGIHESTQALLDRLERLADLRDRGLLGRDGVRDREGDDRARAGDAAVRIRPPVVNVIMLVAIVLGVVAGSRLFALVTGGEAPATGARGPGSGALLHRAGTTGSWPPRRPCAASVAQGAVVRTSHRRPRPSTSGG